MPWSYPTNVPSFAKNKSTEEQKVAIDAANAVLAKGASENDAIFAAIAAVKTYNRKQSQQKAVEAPKRSLPSHIAAVLQKVAIDVPDQINEKNLGIRREFLGKNALQVGVDRNLVSVELSENLELVHTFDTAEKIKTDLSRLNQIVENYINVVNEQKNTTGGLIKFETNLVGFSEIYSSSFHGLTEIVNISFTKNNKEVSVDWSFDTQQNIVVNSNVDLTGVTLTAYGS